MTGYYTCGIHTGMRVYIRRGVFKFWKLVAHLGQFLINLGAQIEFR